MRHETGRQPTAAEMIRAIRGSGYARATRVLRGRQILHSEENAASRTLVIEKTPDICLTLTADADGRVTASHRRLLEIPLYIKATHTDARSNPFTEAVANARDTALQEIQKELRELTGHGDAAMGRDTVSMAVNRTVQAAVTSVTEGRIRSPQAVGAARIHWLLGKERASRAMATAGGHATIDEANELLDTETPQEAAKTAPNAVIYWYAWRRQGDPKEPIPSSPKEMLQQARETFEKNRAEADRMHPGIAGIRTKTLWERYLALNQTAINHRAPLKGMAPLLAAAAEMAGTNPPYSVLIQLLGQPTQTERLPLTLLTAAFTEGERRRSKKLTIRRVTDILRRAQEMMDPRSSLPGIDATEPLSSLLETEDSKTWEDWADATGTWDDPGPRRNGNKKTQTDRTKNWQEFRKRAEETLTASTAWTKEATLTVAMPREGTVVLLRPDGHTEVEVHRHQDGRVTVNREDAIDSLRVLLPLESQGTKSKGNTGSWGAAAEINFTAANAALESAGLPRPKGMAPQSHKNAVTAAARAAAETRPAEDRAPDDEQVSEAMAEAIKLMLDSETAELATEPEDRNLPLSRYNTANCLITHARTILNETPALPQWIIAYTGTQEAAHAGQLIGEAKANLREAGAQPGTWRILAALDAQAGRALDQAQNPEEAAATLNALLQAGARTPSATTVTMAAGVIQAMLNAVPDEKNEATQLARRNAEKAAGLLVREGTIIPRYHAQVRDLADYVAATSAAGEELTATTAGGLRKRSERWHRTINQERADEDWRRIILRRNAMYLEWNSLVDSVRAGDHTAVAVTSEKGLYEESKRLRHCIVNYGDQCAKGTTRIFAIRGENGDGATTQLELVDSTWIAIQTRGEGNRQPTAPEENAAQRAAEAYNRAWTGNTAAHSSRLTPATGTELATVLSGAE